MNTLFGGEHNFATSTYFLRFDDELLMNIYLMKVITAWCVKTMIIGYHVKHALLSFCLPYLMCIRYNKNVMYFLSWNKPVSKKYYFSSEM